MHVDIEVYEKLVKKSLNSRRQRGSILTIVVLVAGIVLLITGMCLTFNGFLFRCSDSQYKIDSLAVQMARSINSGDRVGQINELTQGARELVYVSNENATRCSDEASFGPFTSLYDQLAQEARDGQKLVESERQNQICLVMSELLAQAHQYNAQSAALQPWTLFWLKTREPRIDRIDIGNVRNMESNVEVLGGLPDLVASDRERGYFDTRSNLYFGRTPSKLASLPACVDGVCSPLRNTNPQAFIRMATLLKDGQLLMAYVDDLPCAVQIHCTLETAVGRDGEHKGRVEEVATAVTNGSVCGH